VRLTLALLLAYSALVIAIGLWIGRRVRSGSDFFVAGRGLGGGLIFSTFLAANIGAGSTVGATALGYKEGLSAWWWNGSAGIGSLVLAFWVGPRIWREAKQFGDYTVGDFLERHYGRAMRGLVAALIWIGTYYILAGQFIGIAAVLYVAGGVPTRLGILLGALVTVPYFVAGQSRAVDRDPGRVRPDGVRGGRARGWMGRPPGARRRCAEPAGHGTAGIRLDELDRARARVHRVAGPDPEGVRRARRARRHAGHRLERRRPAGVRERSGADRHRRPHPLS
jgi:hypothetical protein